MSDAFWIEAINDARKSKKTKANEICKLMQPIMEKYEFTNNWDDIVKIDEIMDTTIPIRRDEIIDTASGNDYYYYWKKINNELFLNMNVISKAIDGEVYYCGVRMK